MSFKVMPITYTAQIGNSDDKLSQEGWSDFVDGLGKVLAALNVDIHFFGFSNPASSWQSCCAVFNAEATREVNDDIRGQLADLARQFQQDSIALTVGTTTFVKAAT